MELVTKDACPEGCNGIEFEPGQFSGCACKRNGAPCDCPNHVIEFTSGSGCAEGCSHPEHKSEVTLDLVKEIHEKMLEKEKTLSHANKRLAFIGGLYAKAEVSHLKRIEATTILSATFAEMIEQTIPGLEDEEAKLEPGCIARANVALMIEIAKAMHAESLALVDAAMANSKLVVVPR